MIKNIMIFSGIWEHDDSLNRDIDEMLPLYWHSFTGNAQKYWYALELFFKN
jgi:hypothetical protein